MYKATGFTVTPWLINITLYNYSELTPSCRGIKTAFFFLLVKNHTLVLTSIAHCITATLKSQLRFAGLAAPTVDFGGLNCGASLLISLFTFFFPLSFFSPGKVAVHSSLRRKINRLVIHRNVNATLVPLGTSVCVAWDHSGLSVQLWTCDKWPLCFSIFNTYTLC